MPSIVRELQTELLDTNANLSNCLNKAYVIARKLHISDFQRFIENEINGYKDEDEVPDYRIVQGIIKAQDIVGCWQSIQDIPRDKEVELSVVKFRQPLIEMETAVTSESNSNTIMIPLESCAGSILLGRPMPVGIFFTVYQIHSIVEKVRYALLNWAITLEENGILGENLSFSADDQHLAKNLPTISSLNIHAQSGATINIASTDNSVTKTQ